MKMKMTKLAAAAVIIIGILFGLNLIGIPIDGASVAWAELVERVEQSHNEYHTELLLAMEEKNLEKVGFYADTLSEFWQQLCWLAKKKLNPELQDQLEQSVQIVRARNAHDKSRKVSQLFVHPNRCQGWQLPSPGFRHG